MKKKIKISIIVLVVIGFLSVAIVYLSRTNIAVLNPQGPIAEKERNLIYFALAMSLLVVIPVFVLTFYFAWHYRESNKEAIYSPRLDRNRVAEFVWWGIPTVIIGILSIVAWNSSHTLDPYRTIASVNQQMTIQVVAMDWKWLFIYPAQGIASVNYAEIPANTPINFELTSDAPMNSFWVPQLGGQIYAMPGMSTQLNLLAYHEGSYHGSSANISGEGFAGMDFTIESTSQSGFDQWVASTRGTQSSLTQNAYTALSQPTIDNPVSTYSNPAENLYNSIIEKYTGATGLTGMGANTGMGM